MKKIKLFLLALLLLVSTPFFAQKQIGKSETTDWKKEISSNYFYIRLADDTTQYWDLPGSHPETANKNIQFQIWNKFDEPYERTFIFPSINGTPNYAIKNKAGYIVDVGGKTELSVKEKAEEKLKNKKFKMKKDNGAEIQTWTYDTGVAKWQQWRIIIVDKNAIIFENVFTNKAIDVKDGKFVNGTKLISWERNNSSSQRFVLEYAEGSKKGQLLNFE